MNIVSGDSSFLKRGKDWNTEVWRAFLCVMPWPLWYFLVSITGKLSCILHLLNLWNTPNQGAVDLQTKAVKSRRTLNWSFTNRKLTRSSIYNLFSHNYIDRKKIRRIRRIRREFLCIFTCSAFLITCNLLQHRLNLIKKIRQPLPLFQSFIEVKPWV